MASKSVAKYNWECVVWVESLPSLDLIYDFGVKGYLSPVHNMDGGKPHYHWILCYTRQVSYDTVMEQLREDGLDACVNTVRYVRDMDTRARYLCHLDEPHKFHYSPEDVKCIGGTDYSKYLYYGEERIDTDMSIVKIIEKYRCRSFAQLVNYSIFVNRSIYKTIAGRANFWSSYIRSLAMDSNSIEMQNAINERRGKESDT